jgi:hypothetical protein
VGKCPKDKIRAHLYSPSSFDRPYAHLQTAKNLPRAASVDFLFVRRECSLAGTIFSSGFIVVHPELLEMIPCAFETGASGGISLARNLMQRRFSKPWPLSEVAHASQLPACRAAVTSVPKEFLFFGCSMHFSEAEKPQQGAT